MNVQGVLEFKMKITKFGKFFPIFSNFFQFFPILAFFCLKNRDLFFFELPRFSLNVC
jgi:hypothetical protein